MKTICCVALFILSGCTTMGVNAALRPYCGIASVEESTIKSSPFLLGEDDHILVIERAKVVLVRADDGYVVCPVTIEQQANGIYVKGTDPSAREFRYLGATAEQASETLVNLRREILSQQAAGRAQLAQSFAAMSNTPSSAQYAPPAPYIPPSPSSMAGLGLRGTQQMLGQPVSPPPPPDVMTDTNAGRLRLFNSTGQYVGFANPNGQQGRLRLFNSTGQYVGFANPNGQQMNVYDKNGRYVGIAR